MIETQDTATVEAVAQYGRHTLPPGAESTLPGLGVVVVAAELSRHELTEIIPVVVGPDEGRMSGFLDGMPEALAEHTAELEAIAAEESYGDPEDEDDDPTGGLAWPLRLWRRLGRVSWTGPRIALLSASAGVVLTLGIEWVLR